MIQNTDYFLTIGVLIDYERYLRKNQTGAGKHYNQEVFCHGICDVKTYRCISNKKREVKPKYYEMLLKRLDLEMNYRDLLYKQLQVRLANLSDAITKYYLHDMEVIYEKILELLDGDLDDCYFIYVRRIVHLLAGYYLHNEFPSEEDIHMLEYIGFGFSSPLYDMILDLLFKYYRLYVVTNETYFDAVAKNPYQYSQFIPNRINYMQYIHDQGNFDEFLVLSEKLIQELDNHHHYFRLIDVYDLQLVAKYYTDPTHVQDIVQRADNNVTSLFEKYKYQPDISAQEFEWPLKRKIAQYSYHKGCILYLMLQYELAIQALNDYLEKDTFMEVNSKVILISSYQFYYPDKEIPSMYFHLNQDYADSKFKRVHQFYQHKYLSKWNHDQLYEFLHETVCPLVLREDDVLKRIVIDEMNKLVRGIKQYRIFQLFLEKVELLP